MIRIVCYLFNCILLFQFFIKANKLAAELNPKKKTAKKKARKKLGKSIINLH